MKKILAIISGLNFLTAFTYSIKFFFVTPDLPGVYYGIVAWVMAFGFAMLTKFTQQ